MPESNELLSAGAQLIGMPLAGPESFSQQQLDYLKRALGVDETVLSSGQSSSTAPITLSEPMSNFEYVEIYGVWSYNTTQQMKVYSKFKGNSTRFSLCGFVCANLAGDSQDMFMLCSDFSVNGATITVNKVLRQNNSGGLLSRTDGIVITKIVGIHRIAGGN